MDVSSSVIYFDFVYWQELGVCILGELLNNMFFIILSQGFVFLRVIFICGFFDFNFNSGIVIWFDDILVNKLCFGIGMLGIEGFDLVMFSNVELICGLGFVMYGVDVFYGVILM